MNKVVYLAHYDFADGERAVSPAGTTVMEYIIDCLKRTNVKTVVLSPTMAEKALSRKEVALSENVRAIFLKTDKPPKRWRIISQFVRKTRHKQRIIKELLSQVNDGDTRLVYHSLSIMGAVKKILKRRKVSLVLQVCEIYADVIENKQIKKREIKFFDLADR